MFKLVSPKTILAELNVTLQVIRNKAEESSRFTKVPFTSRIVDQWNHQPSIVVTADNINVFKSRLGSYSEMYSNWYG